MSLGIRHGNVKPHRSPAVIPASFSQHGQAQSVRVDKVADMQSVAVASGIVGDDLREFCTVADAARIQPLDEDLKSRRLELLEVSLLGALADRRHLRSNCLLDTANEARVAGVHARVRVDDGDE